MLSLTPYFYKDDVSRNGCSLKTNETCFTVECFHISLRIAESTIETVYKQKFAYF